MYVLSVRTLLVGKSFVYKNIEDEHPMKVRLVCEDCVGFDSKTSFQVTSHGSIETICGSPVSREMTRMKELRASQEKPSIPLINLNDNNNNNNYEVAQNQSIENSPKNPFIVLSKDSVSVNNDDSPPVTPTPIIKTRKREGSSSKSITYIACQHRCKDKSRYFFTRFRF